MTDSATAVITADQLGLLISQLREQGWRVVGPTVRDGTILPGELRDVTDLPAGWGDEQAPGRYRLRERDDGAWFGYAVGPGGPRRELLPPRHRLFTAVAEGDTEFRVVPTEHAPPAPIAFLGARACELAAIAIQDRVYLAAGRQDAVYAARRRQLLIVAVECGEPAGTCFCASMGTGPAVTGGADLTLTELLDGEHRFLARPGTDRGAELLAGLASRPATDEDLAERGRRIEDASRRMGRELDTSDVHDLLLGNPEHPRWDDVAERCLACTNCTLVCPTCFCTTVEDTTDLTGTEAYRDRRWDSCFTLEFSHAGPASVRTSTRARYRQWLTHKLATWVDQFDTSGCVGCGRCITWCPVGIDITEEVAAIRATDDHEEGA